MPEVYFDESGNTGENLWDGADPVFTLASCSFTPEVAQKLHGMLIGRNAQEIKFSNLRRKEQGRRKLLEFLAAPEVTADTVAILAFHKPFMAAAKYCDVMLEILPARLGKSIYDDGLNIIASNMLHYHMPSLLEPGKWHEFLQLFVQAVRSRDQPTFSELHRCATAIHGKLQVSHPFFAGLFLPVIRMDPSGYEFFKELEGDDGWAFAYLDPIVTSYYRLCGHWGRQLQTMFNVVADESKALKPAVPFLLRMADQNVAPFTIGPDEDRTMDLPLKVIDIQMVKSVDHAQVQLADILAGAAATWLKAKATRSLSSFELEIGSLILSKRLIFDAVWPDKTYVEKLPRLAVAFGLVN